MSENDHARTRALRIDARDVLFATGFIALPLGAGLWNVPVGVFVLGVECLATWAVPLVIRLRR